MADSQLAASDVRSLFLLLGELTELGASADAWRGHLVRSLTTKLGARVAVMDELSLTHASPENLEALSCGHFVDRVHAQVDGLSPTRVESFRAAVFDLPNGEDPAFARKSGLYGRDFTVSRRELVSDHAWYRSAAFHERYRVYDCDDYIESQVVLPESLVSSIALYRGWRERRFSPRERLFVGLLHEELGRRWSVMALPPMSRRERETLSGLRLGLSEKELASRLGIAHSTVHDYVKGVYRKLGVRSRGELHARLEGARAPALVKHSTAWQVP